MNKQPTQEELISMLLKKSDIQEKRILYLESKLRTLDVKFNMLENKVR